MAKPKPKPIKSTSKPKKAYLSQSDVPWYSVDEALKVAEAIVHNYGSKPTKPLDVAAGMDMAPNSVSFRMLTGSSIAYGLTEGGCNSAQIVLTPLALKILKPQADNDMLDGKREALAKPRVIGEFLNKYNNNPVPRDDIARNVLEAMSVPKDRLAKVLDMILEGAKSVGFLTDIRGKKYVNLQGVAPPDPEPSSEEEDGAEPVPLPNGIAGKPATQP